jgi:hypothetical protein
VTLVWIVEAGQEVEQSGLSGTIGADDRGDGVALDFEMIDVHGN